MEITEIIQNVNAGHVLITANDLDFEAVVAFSPMQRVETSKKLELSARSAEFVGWLWHRV
jgi:hypothetical protein